MVGPQLHSPSAAVAKSPPGRTVEPPLDIMPIYVQYYTIHLYVSTIQYTIHLYVFYYSLIRIYYSFIRILLFTYTYFIIQLYVFYYSLIRILLFTIYYSLFTIYHLPFTIYYLLFAI